MCQPTTNSRKTVIEDPTRQAGNRRRAIADIRRRLRGAKRDIVALIDSANVTLKTSSHSVVNRTAYQWEMDPERLRQIDALIFDTVNRWFDTSADSMPSRWFFTTYSEVATQQATADAVSNIKNVSRGIVPAAQLDQQTVQNIFSDLQYRRVISNIYGRAFNEMKGFADETAADLARVLADSIFLGQSAKQAKSMIAKRFGVGVDELAKKNSLDQKHRIYPGQRLQVE